MIAKAVKGRGFRGALEYDMEPEKGRVIDSNMSGETPRELAAEFGAIRKLRPGLNRAVLHVSLSAAPGEHLTDEQWAEIGQRYLSGMGLDDNQYVMTRHTDTDHEHIHILANRITFAGVTVSDSQDYKRQEALMREIEKEFGLKAVEPSKDAIRRAATRGETEKTKRTGEPSTRSQLQQLADAAAKDCHSFTEYAKRLDARAVSIVPVFQGDGARLSGLSYKLNGEVMKGSDLGKGYAPAGLAKRGVTYEKARDYQAMRSLIDPDRTRAAVREARAAEKRAQIAEIMSSLVRPEAPAAPVIEPPDAAEREAQRAERFKAALAAMPRVGKPTAPERPQAPVAPALERPKTQERTQGTVAPALDRPKAETPAPAPVAKDAARVSNEFADLASKRETQQQGYRNLNDAWRYDTPAKLRSMVDEYNKLPKEQRPAELARIAADPSTDALLKQRTREQVRSR